MSRKPSGDRNTDTVRNAPPQTAIAHNAETDFDALFLAHYPAVYRLLCRIAGTREEAEDLAQETFLRLHRSPQLWDRRQAAREEHNVRGWLLRVAANLAYNALRGRGRRERREDRAAGREVYGRAAEPDPAQLVQQAEERAAVRNTLACLPERQAQLLLLRYAGLSYRELAELLGIAPGSVGTLLARAEAAFETAYRPEGRAEGGET